MRVRVVSTFDERFAGLQRHDGGCRADAASRHRAGADQVVGPLFIVEMTVTRS